MFATALYLSYLFHHLIFIFLTTANTTSSPYEYTPTDYILLDCGSSSNSTSAGRNWQGDADSSYLPSNAAATKSLALEASTHDPSITQKVPYMTARVFLSPFTYTFSQLSTGPKFVRLYFYPATYASLSKEDSFFSVIANNYTLLSNFSAFLTVSYPMPASPPTLVKEYFVHINDDHQLNVTFLPSRSSYAFVNGIELVSVPDNLYYDVREDYNVRLIDQTISPMRIGNDTAFETVYRLNVGGREIQVTEDTGMFRAWDQDIDYLLGGSVVSAREDFSVNYSLDDAPPYTAPEMVYTTARFMNNFSFNHNMTWLFPVDSGFYYLLRLHFCVFFPEITGTNDLVFTILINNQTAEPEADVIDWGNGPLVAVKKDYIAHVTNPDGRQSKQDLWLALQTTPYSSPASSNALLNGLEVFKLNRSNGSLAAATPSPLSIPTEKKSKRWLLILSVSGGVCLVISFVVFLIFRQRQRVKDSISKIAAKWRSTEKSWLGGSALPSVQSRRFSLEEIKCATGNFDPKFVVGVGGFGFVYKGYVDNGTTGVAIKRFNPSSNQGAREFLTEIEMLSKLRHLQLVSLVGYCDENGEMILVYDYMSHGTLRDHLYNTQNPPLPWKQRLQICIGAAKGLLYLHTSAKHTIIHRDVKSTNILLDENWVAKVSDFGLSKMGPIGGTYAHVSTAVKGSFGYMDPEYYRRQQLTEKSDVYSFGVVLLEVLCARPVINSNLPEEQVSLAEWACYCYREGTLDQIIDPNLKDQISAECLNKYIEIAFSCLKDKGIKRPTMNDVVWGLEFALKLQDTAENGGSAANTSSSFPLILHGDVHTPSGSNINGNFTIMSEGFKSPQTVFTEILNPFPR